MPDWKPRIWSSDAGVESAVTVVAEGVRPAAAGEIVGAAAADQVGAVAADQRVVAGAAEHPKDAVRLGCRRVTRLAGDQ